MKNLERIRKTLFVLAMFSITISIETIAYSALIIDHTCRDLSQVPEYWINQAKDLFNASYGHTSHGSQIVTGMNMVIDEHGSLYSYDYTSGSCSFSGEFLCDSYPSGDLGNPDRETWAQRTRDLLDNSSNDRNLIIWSWCGQHNTSEENINIYLNLMNQLEADYPDIVFVYMTGHLNSGSGPPDGQTYLRNEQIRQYCQDNNKILFDFADIESWDPDGNDHRDDDDACYWCADWCSTHSCPSCGSCAHSHCFNCYQKGKAFWWMMARLAGWDQGTTTDSDGDGFPDDEDNCPDTPNPTQEDTLPDVPNDCGDVCECEGDLNGDGEVQGLDTIIYKAGYPRSYYLNEPCAVCIGGSNDGAKCLNDAECPDGDCGQNPTNPCIGDLNCDMEVSGLDTILYKEDYPRTEYLGVPCPECSRTNYPCSYPE